MEVLLRVGLTEARGRTLEGQSLQVFTLERFGQPLDDLLHHRASGNRVALVDVGAQLAGCLAHDRLRHVDLPKTRHSVDSRDGPDRALEDVGVYRNRRHTVLAVD